MKTGRSHFYEKNRDMDTDTLLEIYLAYRGTEQVAYEVQAILA